MARRVLSENGIYFVQVAITVEIFSFVELAVTVTVFPSNQPRPAIVVGVVTERVERKPVV